jgi:aspartate aminotransferase-like enzyme
MLKRRLFTPGPVPVPERVRLAMAQEILHHRSADFIPMFQRCKAGLQRVFQTNQPVLILSSSGTGAMDAAVSNTLSPGDHALVVRGGKFGERWAEICERYCVRTTCLDVEWGRGIEPAELRRALDANPDVRAVFVTASETSTGASHPLREIAEIVRRRDDVLLVVDGITAVGVCDVPMDAWGIDVLVAGSQKAFMLPPGLAFIALSPRAWEFQKRATCPRFYFDLAEELEALEGDQTAWTPAVSLLFGLDEALRIMLDEVGLEATWRRTEAIARATREAMRAIGLELYAPDAPSPACTAVKVPAGVDGPKLRKCLRDELGFTVADGQGRAKGKIFRIAHLGYFDAFDTLAVIAAVELALARLGFAFKLGEGVRTALELLRDEA